MAFFQRQCYGPEPGFAPLVRLLNDWDTLARDNVHQRRRTPTFVPKFDVIETEADYQLHGELGGISKQNLNIEFIDEHTLVIKGHVEKSYKTANNTEAAQASGANPAAVTGSETTTSAAAADEDDITESTIIEAPVQSHQATVSDDEEEEAKHDSAAIEALQRQKKEQQELERQQREQQQQEEEREKRQRQKPAYKYWLAERSAGEFSRVFKFPGRVEREGVTAALENGILTVTVPKAKKLPIREVPIF